MTTTTNHYDVLGVHQDASPDDIKKAWRQAAKAAHPDKNQAGDANKRMAAINKAYEVLTDPKKRDTHDEELSNQSKREPRTTNRPDSSDSHYGGPSWRDDARTRAQRSRQHEDARRRAEEYKRRREAEAKRQRETEEAERHAKEEEARRQRENEARRQAEEQRQREEELVASTISSVEAAVERLRVLWKKAAEGREEAKRLAEYEIEAEEKRQALWLSASNEREAGSQSTESDDGEEPQASTLRISKLHLPGWNPLQLISSAGRFVSRQSREDLRQPDRVQHHAEETARRIAWATRKDALRLAEIGRLQEDLDERKAGNYTNQGFESVRKGDFEQALVEFSAAIGITNPTAPLFAARGNVYAAMGRNVAAIHDFTDSLRLTSNAVPVLRLRAEAYLKQREFRLALEDLSASLNLDPMHAESLRQRAEVNAKLGDWRQASLDRDLADKLNTY